MAQSPTTPSVAKQTINVNLTGGVNKKRDTRSLENGELLTADNVTFSTIEGQVTKRYGCASINPQGAPLQGGPFKSFGVRDNIEPLILGASTLNRYNPEQNLSTSIPTPTQGRLDVSQVAGSSGKTTFPYPPSDASVATDGAQYACVTWQEPNLDATLCYYGVQDLATGNWIIPPTVLPNLYPTITTISYISMMAPSVKYRDGKFYLFYIWSGLAGTSYYNYLVYNLLSVSNLSAGVTPGTLQQGFPKPGNVMMTLAPNFYSYDIHMAGDKWISVLGPSTDDNASFAYWLGRFDASGNLLYDASGTIVSSYAGTSQRCAVRADGPAATPYLVGLTNSLTIITSANVATTYRMSTTGSPQILPVDCVWLPSGNAVWLGYNGTASGLRILATQVVPGSGAMTKVFSTPPLTTFYQQVLSRLFTVQENGKVYAWIGAAAPSSDSVYNSAYLTEFDFASQTSMAICRTLYMKNAHITYSDMTFPCDIVRVGTTSKYVTFISSALEKTGSTWRAFGALNRVQFDFAPARWTQLIPLPQGGVLGAGSYPFYYDGTAVMEAGFSSPPTGDAMSATMTTIQGGTPTVLSDTSGLAGGTSLGTSSGSFEYYYAICLVRRDAYGNVYRSAPSPIITVPCPNAVNKVYFPGYTYNGGGNVMIEYYRSTQNVTGSHYFIGQVANGAAFTDGVSDGAPGSKSSITKNRLLYTDAGEITNDPPPAIHHAAVGQSRVFIIPADARSTLWFSKRYSSGRTVEFSAENVISEGTSTSAFIAVQVLDSNVIVFKEDQILYFYGEGPDNAGNGSFSSFIKLTTDVGCIDPASVVTIPGGILFRSRRGIELLNRSLQVQYVGAPVEPLLKDMGNLASAVVVPQFTQARFVPQKAGKPVLVFDYGKNRWSTFSNMAASNAAMVNGEYWWVAQDGSKVFRETPGAYTDDGKPITMTLETPEIPVSGNGAQGWGRAYRMALLGQFYGDCSLTVEFAYDHSPVYQDSIRFDSANGLVNGDSVFQFRASRLPRQVMQTVRMRITDTDATGTSSSSGSYGISDLSLEVGPKSGLARLLGSKTL